MKFISKVAYYIGYRIFEGERFDSWTCPNEKCGMPVSDDYRYCPYCGQKLIFRIPKEDLKMIEFSYNPAKIKVRLTSYDQDGNLLINEEERLLRDKGYYDKDEMYKMMMHLAEQLAKYEDAYFGKTASQTGIFLKREGDSDANAERFDAGRSE